MERREGGEKVERLGEILKNTRLEKGLTLEDVEKNTKIRRQYLEAMENEHWDFFEEYVYLKSFLRTYCRYLDLDNRESLYFLIEDLKPKPRPQKLPEQIDLTAAPRRKTGVFLGIIAIILLLTTSYIYKQYLNPFPHLSEVPQLGEGKETLLPEQSGQEQPKLGEPGLSEPEENQVTEGQTQKINRFRLSLKCIDDRCWVEVKNSEGEHLYQGIMVKDEEISFSDLQKITLKLGNAGQVQVTINEANLGVLGEIGAVVTKIYGLENGEIKELGD